MDIMNSILGLDIKNILEKASPKYEAWLLQFHTPTEDVDIFKLISIDVVKDYENNFGDELIVNIIIPGGDWMFKLYPHLDHLQATLYKFSTTKNSTERLIPSKAIKATRYVASVIKPPAMAVEQNAKNEATEKNLNITQLLSVDVQLIPATIDQLRMMTVGGVFRNTSCDELIKSMLTVHSKKVEVSSEMLPSGVNMIPVDNLQKREHFVIPQGTRVVDVPGYIHKKCGGVYSTGFSYYFQDNYWYVYPTYNTERFNSTEKIMTIINVPSKRLPGNEKSFITEGNHTIILATGETKFTDVSEPQLLNMGNGLRFSDANKYMESFVDISDNKAVVSRGKNNSEFITLQRPNGFNNAAISSDRISSNAKLELSKLAARDGVMISLSWENSDTGLIYPGMPVKFRFLKDDVLKEVEGVILKAHDYIQMVGDGLLNNRYISTTNFAIFVKRQVFKGL